MQSHEEREIHPRKRVKYATHACLECRRRKVRCSGDEPCRGCRTSRSRICGYQPDIVPAPTPAWNGLTARYAQVSQGQGGAFHANDVHLPEQHLHPAGVLLEAGGDATIQEQPLTAINSRLTDSGLVSQPFLQHHPLAAPQPLPDSKDRDTPEYVSSKLFPNQQLSAVLRLCFEELELFYPCIDRVDFYNRLSDLFLLHSICQGKSTRIPTDPNHLSLAALTCLLLAIGTYLGADSPLKPDKPSKIDDYYRQTSLLWYAESSTLLNQVESAEDPNLDLIRYHMLEIVYMNMLGRRGGMSRSLALAVDLAYSLEINDERTWSSCTLREREHRRILWWTLIYMDCRIALHFQRPLLLHHSDYHVGDFTHISFGHYMQDAESNSSQAIGGWGTLRLPWPLPARPPENYSDWLLFSMRWSKLVGRVWHGKLSLRATQHTAESIETMDASLAAIESALPPSLQWNTGHLPTSITAGAMDRECRFRVLVFEATADLRLSVRSSHPVLAHDAGARITANLTASVMNAIVSYLVSRNYARPWSTYASRLLVQLSSRAAPLLRATTASTMTISSSNRRNALSEPSYSLITSMSNAHACMQDMAASIKLFAARNASTKLGSLLEGLGLPQAGLGTGLRLLLCAPEPSGIDRGEGAGGEEEEEADDDDKERTESVDSSPAVYRDDDDAAAGDVIWENLFSLT